MTSDRQSGDLVPWDQRPRRRRVPQWAASLVIVGSILVAITGVPLAMISREDSGIAMCRAMAQDGGSRQITPEEARDDRQAYSESAYPEIRDPGVRVIDLIVQMSAAEAASKDGTEILSFVGPFTEAYADLARGCQVHGYTIPAMSH